MENTNNLENKVTATKIEGQKRLDMLPKYFNNFMEAESWIFDTMGKFFGGYSGAYWEFYELSNSGFYMAPSIENELNIQNIGNYFSGSMSADAAGIVVCLMVYSNMSFHDESGSFTELFHNLREFALDHEEAAPIFRAID